MFFTVPTSHAMKNLLSNFFTMDWATVSAYLFGAMKSTLLALTSEESTFPPLLVERVFVSLIKCLVVFPLVISNSFMVLCVILFLLLFWAFNCLIHFIVSTPLILIEKSSYKQDNQVQDLLVHPLGNS